MNPLIVQILQQTPRWVYGLLIALVVLGTLQLFPRQAGLRRVVLLPLAMGAWSLASLTGSFGIHAQALLAWALTAAAGTALLGRAAPPAGTRYDPATQRYALPGSVLPLLTFLGIFAIRYGVNVLLALSPARAHDATFAVAAGVLYGACSGLLLGRALPLWKLALRTATPPALA
jgi:hypothetical protein